MLTQELRFVGRPPRLVCFDDFSLFCCLFAPPPLMGWKPQGAGHKFGNEFLGLRVNQGCPLGGAPDMNQIGLNPRSFLIGGQSLQPV